MNKIIKHFSYVYLEYIDKTRFRFQSTDPRVIRKMKRRKDFSQVGFEDISVFVTHKYNAQSAKRTLERLTGSKAKYNPKSNDYTAISHTIVTKNSRSLTTKSNKERKEIK